MESIFVGELGIPAYFMIVLLMFTLVTDILFLNFSTLEPNNFYYTALRETYIMNGSALIVGSTVGIIFILKTCAVCAVSRIVIVVLLINFAGVWVVGGFISLFIQAFIYPTEVISVMGFVMIFLISIYVGYQIVERVQKINTTALDLNDQIRNPQCYRFFSTVICFQLFIPGLNLAILLSYMSLLQIVLESPTSQLTQILLAFLPTIFAAFLGYLIERKSKLQNMPIQHQDDNITSNTRQESDEDHSSNRNEEAQYLNRPRRRLILNSGIDERSREMVVTVQTHHDQTLDIDSESII